MPKKQPKTKPDSELHAKLADVSAAVNLAESLEQKLLNEIGQKCLWEYDSDKRSRRAWEEQYEQSLKLSQLFIEHKDFPFTNASPVIYPLLSQACILFHSKSMQMFIPEDGKPVRGKILGDDPDGMKAKAAERVGDYMSYQLTLEQPEWWPGLDKMMMNLPNAGCSFRKIFYDPALQRNVSKYVPAEDLVVFYGAEDLASAKRVSHYFEIDRRRVIELQRKKTWLEVDLGSGDVDARTGGQNEYDYTNPSYKMVEQSCWLDLDKDGVFEPWIVTFHHTTGKVVRLKARWKPDGILISQGGNLAQIVPTENYVQYQMMPAFDGNIYGFGFGALLQHPNNAINAMLRQTIDAGTWYNSRTGLVSDKLEIVNQSTGEVRFRPGEWKQFESEGIDDIRRHIYEFTARPPSATLYQTMGALIEAAERLGSSVDVMSGVESRSGQPATTTLALIEQGSKFMVSVNIRLLKSFQQELRILYGLNAEYLTQEAYANYHDVSVDVKNDFDPKSVNIVPTGNPKDVMETAKLLKIQAAYDIFVKAQFPIPEEIQLEMMKYSLRAIQMPEVAAKLTPEILKNRPPSLEAIQANLEAKLNEGKLQLDWAKLQLEARKVKILEDKTQYEIAKMKVDGAAKMAKTDIDKKKADTAAEAIKNKQAESNSAKENKDGKS